MLYPDDEQQTLIAKTFGCCRFVYNRALDERITEYKENKRTVTLYEQINDLPGLKKQKETEWLKEVDSTALQYSLRILQDAYDNFFAFGYNTLAFSISLASIL